MYFNQIHYDLKCNSCKSERPNGMTTYQSDADIDYPSKEELITAMENFKQVQCETCENMGDWSVVNIDLSGNDEVQGQIRINILKENGLISGKPDEDYYPADQLDAVYMKIRGKIEEAKGQYLLSKSNGSAFFVVDLLNDEPHKRVSKFYINGLSIEEIKGFINTLTEKKGYKGISEELRLRLGNAFEDLKTNTLNPLVIAHLQSKDKATNFYVIAKVPDEELYYGIMENYGNYGKLWKF